MTDYRVTFEYRERLEARRRSSGDAQAVEPYEIPATGP